MSQSKGRRSEREVELVFQRAGLHTERAIGGRSQVSGDIAVASPPLAIEVRRREQLLIPRWCAEHEASTPDHMLPALVWRKSREPWRISLRLDDFLEVTRFED